MDSGSSVTLLRYKVAQQLDLKLGPCTLDFGCAAGIKISVMGETQFEFEILGKKVRHPCVVVDVERVSYQGLLGLDFLKDYGGICEFKTDMIHFPWASAQLETNNGKSEVEALVVQPETALLVLLDSPPPSQPQTQSPPARLEPPPTSPPLPPPLIPPEPPPPILSQILAVQNYKLPPCSHTELTCTTSFAPGSEVFVDSQFPYQNLHIPPITTMVDENSQIRILATNLANHALRIRSARLTSLRAELMENNFVLSLQPVNEHQFTSVESSINLLPKSSRSPLFARNHSCPN